MNNKIIVKGARQHNLKNIDLEIPKNKLVVFTGVSGSGKSSLAFDTIYAEGQRRYVESLSTYARQFLGIMEKPDVDLIEGLSPAISIDQKTTSRNPRSTVGTVTEIYDYLRLVYAKIGHPHCPVCQREISRQSLDQIVNKIMVMVGELLKNRKVARLYLFSPVVVDRKGEFNVLFENLRSKGFSQIRVDGIVKNLSDNFVLIKTNKHSIDAVVDRLSIDIKSFNDEIAKKNLLSRLSDSVQQALNLSDGLVIVSEVLDKSFEMPAIPKEFEDHLFSERFACPVDNIQIDEIEPRTFSFNSPHGACPKCSGLGKILKVEPSALFAPQISIKEGSILPFSGMFEHDTWYSRLILKVCEDNNINVNIPVSNLSAENIDVLLYGTKDKEYKVEGTNRFGRQTYIYEAFAGIVNELERRHSETSSDYVRAEIEKYMREKICPECGGKRLKKEALGITLNKLSIADFSNFSILNAKIFIEELVTSPDRLSVKERQIASAIFKEIIARLGFLVSVGLEYLTIDRPAGSLSGGEAQRIRLASQIGSGLTGVLYVLDEPTIGLHQRDNEKLIRTLKELRDLGNTVIVVEHDADMIKNADEIVDFGPGAGKFGGSIVSQGTLDKILNDPHSITGKYVSGKKKILFASAQNNDDQKYLKFYGATQNNLKNIDVQIPLGKFVVISGVSGSGKSTLLVDTIYPALALTVNPEYRGDTAKIESLEGAELMDKVILIDQSPIGRTPRSNPATYTKVFDSIRDVFAQTKDARAFGFKKGRFSFNVKDGRCENCEGQGQIKIEMQFMSDIWISCEVCGGNRYNNQTLEVTYKGKNIADVLKMTVTEAKEFFHAHRKITDKLETLEAVGLNYMELGQPATTLSGGEAQRVKLSSELARRDTGRTFYILDEPTTGLHFSDLEKLLKVLKILVEKGNSVVVIEHNLDIIKNADWIIDLGPEGGDNGGNIVYEGTPAQLLKSKNSYTAKFIKDL